jgi:hypothetical protein
LLVVVAVVVLEVPAVGLEVLGQEQAHLLLLALSTQ